ncbi:MAG TPA: CAP domain-containing protein [Candidatus Saccharimonadales bacterium]|nr:CAP domain-containing protein [Candidatus Saccharimonadales bacterium]
MKTKKPIRKLPLKKHLHRQVKLAVVPHKSNQYRPHLIRRYGLVAIFVGVIGLQLGYNVTTTGTVLGDKASITVAALLNGTNDARRSHNLNDIQLNQQLNQAAYLKANDMFAQQYWAHTAPDGTEPWKWFAQAGYDYARAGENLAKNFYTAESATQAWLNSPEHRANILEPGYKDVGFAVVSGNLDDKPATIVVALYGQPATEGVAGVQSTVATASTPTGGIVTQLGMAVQSMTPAVLGSMLLLSFATGIAVMAHMYRQKLPKVMRQSWYRHHGAIKAGGMLTVMVVMLALYSGGQI